MLLKYTIISPLYTENPMITTNFRSFRIECDLNLHSYIFIAGFIPSQFTNIIFEFHKWLIKIKIPNPPPLSSIEKMLTKILYENKSTDNFSS